MDDKQYEKQLREIFNIFNYRYYVLCNTFNPAIIHEIIKVNKQYKEINYHILHNILNEFMINYRPLSITDTYFIYEFFNLIDNNLLTEAIKNVKSGL